MSFSLVNIGRSGVMAARTSLEVTAQNIANAQTEGYVRRRTSQEEVAAPDRVGDYTNGQFNGVRIEGIYRPDTPLLSAEVRRSSASFAQADAEVSALTNTETALEQSGLYGAIVEFEAAFAQLQSDPLNASLRSNALEQGSALAETFQLTSNSLEESGDFLRLDAQSGVATVNDLSAQLADTNLALVRTETGTGSQATLLDQRDFLLGQLSQEVGISTEFGFNGSVNVRLGDSSGGLLVDGTAAATLSAAAQADGTLNFDLDGAAVTPVSGRLTGQANALITQADVIADLDAIASSTIAALNNAQANGTAADGSAGQPFFSGSGASDIAAALTDGAAIATAPTGALAGSLDTSNLAALRSVLSNGGPAAQTDSLLLELASNVRNRTINRDALATIAESAQTSLASATEVDLDAEAANLVRFQQSFEASGRVIQVANELFDTILGIR